MSFSLSSLDFSYCRKKSMSGFLLLGKGKASFSLPSRIHNYILRLWIRAPMLGHDCNAVQVIDLAWVGSVLVFQSFFQKLSVDSQNIEIRELTPRLNADDFLRSHHYST